MKIEHKTDVDRRWKKQLAEDITHEQVVAILYALATNDTLTIGKFVTAMKALKKKYRK
jgi:hypothetical protein